MFSSSPYALEGLIFAEDLTYELLPFTSGLEARLAVPGSARLVWSFVVRRSLLGESCPSQRACRAGDVVPSRSSAPVYVNPGNLKMPCSSGGPPLVVADLRRRRGDLVSDDHAWCARRHARFRSFASATPRSPETSSASPRACLHVPSMASNVISVFAMDVSVTCGSWWSHPCNRA